MTKKLSESIFLFCIANVLNGGCTQATKVLSLVFPSLSDSLRRTSYLREGISARVDSMPSTPLSLWQLANVMWTPVTNQKEWDAASSAESSASTGKNEIESHIASDVIGIAEGDGRTGSKSDGEMNRAVDVEEHQSEAPKDSPKITDVAEREIAAGRDEHGSKMHENSPKITDVAAREIAANHDKLSNEGHEVFPKTTDVAEGEVAANRDEHGSKVHENSPKITDVAERDIATNHDERNARNVPAENVTQNPADISSAWKEERVKDVVSRLDVMGTGNDESGSEDPEQGFRKEDVVARHSPSNVSAELDNLENSLHKLLSKKSPISETAVTPQELAKVEDIIARARDIAEGDLTTAQTEVELNDTREELARLDKLKELSKIEDVVSRAHLTDTDTANVEEQDALEQDALQRLASLAQDPLERKAQELQHKLGCLEDEKAKLEDVLARSESLQEETFRDDRNEEAVAEASDTLAQLKDEMAKIDQSVDTALVAPIVPSEEGCHSDPVILQQQEEALSRERSLKAAQDRDDCEIKSALEKFRDMNDTPSSITASSTPEEVAMKTKLQAAEQSAVTTGDAAVADAVLAVSIADEAMSQAEMLASKQREKDELLHMADREMKSAAQDDAIAQKALEEAAVLDAKTEDALDVTDLDEKLANKTAFDPSEPSPSVADSVEATRPNFVVEYSHKMPDLTFLMNHSTKKRRVATLGRQEVMNEPLNDLREAEEMSKIGKEEAEKAETEAEEAAKLGTQAQKMAEQVLQESEKVEDELGTAKAVEDKSLALGQQSNDVDQNCDDVDRVEEAADLSQQVENSLSGLSAGMGSMKRDVVDEIGEASIVIDAGQDLADDAKGLILEAECEEAHQNASEKAIAMAMHTSLHHVQHPCDLAASIACGDDCAESRQCVESMLMPQPVDPCEDVMANAGRKAELLPL